MLTKMALLCSSVLLLSCADLKRAVGLESPVDASYELGRQHHLAGRYEAAISAYQAQLAAVPQHAQARNALAAAYASQGDFAPAIALWRGLTSELAAGVGPDHAYLFVNLGYAYLLSGESQNAVAVLEQACVRDPLDARAWQHLGVALQRLGQHARAASMLRQATALREHDFQRDYAVAGGSAVAAIDAAVTQPARTSAGWAELAVRTAVDGSLELVRLPAVPLLAQPVPATAPRSPALALLEIRNGNGVTGMARALARQVGSSDLQVKRLSNEKGFAVRHTRIEHHPDFRLAAQQLADRMGGRQHGRFEPVPLIEVATPTRTDLRLVLGQDITRGRLVLRPTSPQRFSARLTSNAAPNSDSTTIVSATQPSSSWIR